MRIRCFAFRSKGRLVRLAVSLGLIAIAAAVSARAQTLTVLHSFTFSEGQEPDGPLLADAAGNLYGVMYSGTIFELVNSSGTYTAKVLYTFVADEHPNPGLVIDGAGNLYGTTYDGGDYNAGTVFEIVNSSGSYTERVLHSFGPPSLLGGDGFSPEAGLVMDAAGNLYGATGSGGDWSLGTVFELVNSSGTYTEKLLYSFGPALSFSNGVNPGGPLVVDASGNVYGMAAGGDEGVGVVFELVNSSGSYTEKVLYSFTGPANGDGAGGLGGLLMDKAGDLYGTTRLGGTSANCAPSFGCGTVFELVNSSGNYTEKVLYSFAGSPSDAEWPYGSPTMDASGNLYGATTEGGASLDCLPYAPGCGTLFELVNTSGSYTEKLLHNFGTFFGDGVSPAGGLVSDASGNLYGITDTGGATNDGTVFMLNPTATAPEAALSPVALRFGDQTVGTSSAPQSVTVTNSGNADLIFGAAAVTLSGANATDFVLNADTCSEVTLAPSAACSVEVSFVPTVLGSASPTLNFADNALNGPQAVSLTGRGVSLGVPSVSPSSLTFGDQIVLTTGAPQTVTLTNTGTGPLGITSIATDKTDYTAVNTCTSSLPVGTDCRISITFTPQSLGTDNGKLIVTDDAAGSPHTVSLAGAGAGYTFGTTPSLPPPSATVKAGGTATYSLPVTPLGGFNQVVSFTCTGSPSLATCVLSPNPMTLDGTHTATLNVTVTTTAATLAPSPHLTPPIGWPFVYLLGLVGLMGLAVLHNVTPRAASSVRPARFWPTVSLAAMLLVAALSGSCGGGGATPPPSSPGTPPGTYYLLVTGTSTNYTNSIPLTLTVQ